jgi:hypothetical protein
MQEYEQESTEAVNTFRDDNTASAREMNSNIQSSEYSSKLAKNLAYILDIIIVLSTVVLSAFAFFFGVPDANKELVYMALGSLMTLTGTVINFHRGTSQGSKDKSDAMARKLVDRNE